MNRVFATAFALALTVMAVACGSSTSPTSVSSVAVTGSVPGIGATSQFSAIATMSDGTTQDVTSLSQWSSSNTASATVSSTGVVTGVAGGQATVQAIYLNVTGSDAITIPAS